MKTQTWYYIFTAFLSLMMLLAVFSLYAEPTTDNTERNTPQPSPTPEPTPTEEAPQKPLQEPKPWTPLTPPAQNTDTTSPSGNGSAYKDSSDTVEDLIVYTKKGTTTQASNDCTSVLDTVQGPGLSLHGTRVGGC